MIIAIVAVALSFFALVGSSITIYFQFFHKPNSLVAAIYTNHPYLFQQIDETRLRIVLPLTIINNGKRNNALARLSIFLSSKKDMSGKLDFDIPSIKFAIEPGRVEVVNAETVESFSLFESCANKYYEPPRTYLGLSFTIITDEGARVVSDVIVSELVLNLDKGFVEGHTTEPIVFDVLKSQIISKILPYYET